MHVAGVLGDGMGLQHALNGCDYEGFCPDTDFEILLLAEKIPVLSDWRLRIFLSRIFVFESLVCCAIFSSFLFF